MKPQNKKTSANLPKAAPLALPKPNLRKRFVLLTVLLGVLLAAGGGFLYWRHQDAVRSERALQADKARFAQVEKDMAAAYAAMTAGDKPVKEEVHKTCGYTAAKYDKGVLHCTINYSFSYHLTGNDSSENKTLSVLSPLKTSAFQLTDFSNQSLNGNHDTDYYDALYLSFDDVQATQCKLKSKRETVKGLLGATLQYAFTCDSVTYRSIYPLAQ